MDPHVSPGVPKEFSILGIGDIYMRVRYPEVTQKIIEEYFGFKKYGEITENGLRVLLFGFDENEFRHEIHIIEDKKSPLQEEGVGAVHHFSFGVETKNDLELLQVELERKNFPNSGIVDREFIVSSYFREANDNLFEIATPLSKEEKDFPQQHKPFEEIPLFLPEFLEKKRKEIEFNVNYDFR